MKMIAKHFGARVRNALRCPCCNSDLRQGGEIFNCVNEECAETFPVLGDVPILLDGRDGLFDFQHNFDRFTRRITTYARIKRWAKRFVPELTANVSARRNYLLAARLLVAECPDPLVLVIGGGTQGAGMAGLTDDGRVEVLQTDVAIREGTQLVCDAHRLPFAAESFDCVVIQAVMEYLQDPSQCVQEMHRVLRPAGMIYSEVPFMQPVHGGEYDFARFTQVGHRRLYRHFDEISSGLCGGPASALACSLQYFLLSFVNAPAARDVLKALTRFGMFWLKYLDYFLVHTKGAIDAASGTFFLGRKSLHVKADREVVTVYKGAVTSDGIFRD